MRNTGRIKNSEMFFMLWLKPDDFDFYDLGGLKSTSIE
jgi:hypothetical protein